MNGKTVDTITLPLDASEDVAMGAARAAPGVAKHLESKAIQKVIYKSGRILNVIAR